LPPYVPPRYDSFRPGSILIDFEIDPDPDDPDALTPDQLLLHLTEQVRNPCSDLRKEFGTLDTDATLLALEKEKRRLELQEQRVRDFGLHRLKKAFQRMDRELCHRALRVMQRRWHAYEEQCRRREAEQRDIEHGEASSLAELERQAQESKYTADASTRRQETVRKMVMQMLYMDV
jgi:hypothetical protein